jgi:hypothetical protein
MRQYVLAAAFGLGTIGAAAAGPLTVTATVGGIATGPDLNVLTFDGPALPSGVTLNLDNAQIVTGSAVDIYAAPYFSANQGALLHESPADGPDATPYLSVEGAGTATFTFSTPQTYFGLLWGSVDDYNALSFYDASGDLIATLGGSAIDAGANGDQGADGTYYVNVLSDTAFTSVVASSSQNAFEFDDVAYDPPPSPAGIPEPGSLAVLGAALVGFWLLRREPMAQWPGSGIT